MKAYNLEFHEAIVRAWMNGTVIENSCGNGVKYKFISGVLHYYSGARWLKSESPVNDLIGHRWREFEKPIEATIQTMITCVSRVGRSTSKIEFNGDFLHELEKFLGKTVSIKIEEQQ